MMQEFREEPVKKKSGGCWKFFTLFFLVFLLVGGAYVWWKYFYNFSDGYRTGLLQKLSHKGNVFKTYEGELILSSVVSSGNVTMASEKFFFSIENDSLARAMMQSEGQRVKLHYIEKKGALPWRGDTPYIVDSFFIADDYYPPPFGYPGAQQQYPQQQQQQQYPQQGQQPVLQYDQNGYPVPQQQQQNQNQQQQYPQQNQQQQYPQQTMPQQQYPQQVQPPALPQNQQPAQPQNQQQYPQQGQGAAPQPAPQIQN